jgi:hypothetical protein
MSIEENGYTNGENGEGASREDSTAEHSFDELARGVSTGTVPRRKALRMLAASLFGGALVAAPAAVAVAAPKPGGTGCSVAGQVRRNGQCVCPRGTTVCGTGSNARCVNNQCGTTSTFNPATCQCEAVNQCGTTEVLCGGQCLAECSGGKVRNPTSCACECPSDPCPAVGQTRDANCQCVCGNNEVLCGGRCLAECGTGEFRNPVTCACEVACTGGTVLCGGQCLAECGSGQVRNPTTCGCECPTGEALCGPTGSQQCVSNACGTGTTFNATTCRCEANACGATNCEGCCGTNASGDPVCRAGTRDANCGTDGGVCTQCTGSATCNQVGTIRKCCIPAGTNLPSSQTCTIPSGSTGTNAQCCNGTCRRVGGSTSTTFQCT